MINLLHMPLKKVSVPLLFFIIFCSCQKKVDTQKQDIPKITVDIHHHDQPKLGFDDFFEYSSHAVLQTTDSSLISKIEKFQLKKNTLYVLDRSNSILMFDITGKFIRSFNHKGQSESEYISANDMEVDDNNNIYVCDFLGNKILKYDDKGHFLQSIKKIPQANSFKLLSHDKIALNLQNGSSNTNADVCYNYLCYEKNRIDCEAVPFNKYLRGHDVTYGHGKSSFYWYNHKMYMTSIFNDTVFIVQEDGRLKPFINYDFGQKRLSINASENETNEYLKSIRTGESVSSLYHFCLFGDYMLVSYNYNDQTTQIISETNKQPIFTGKFNSDKNGLYIIPIIYLSDAETYQLATIVNAESFDFILKKNKQAPAWIQEIAKSIKKEDNPVIVFYKWIYQAKSTKRTN